MKNHYVIFLMVITLVTIQTVSAQFPRIRIPGAPKPTQPAPQPANPSSPAPSSGSSVPVSGGGGKSAGVYLSKPTSTPVLLKDTLDVQTHRIQGYRDNTKQWAWLPKVRFYTF